MAAAAHSKGGYGGVPQSVGKDFNAADAGTGIISGPRPKPMKAAPITPPSMAAMPMAKPKQKPKMNRSAAVVKRGFHKMGKM